MTRIRIKPIFNRPGTALALGFTAMLVFMVFLAAIGIIQLEAGQQRLDKLVKDPVAKMTYANRMYMAARERTDQLDLDAVDLGCRVVIHDDAIYML